jgi:hypothetical protein
MFIGYSRSGHSLIAALLDAHPNIIVAHELSVLKRIREGLAEEQIYCLLLENSRARAKTGRKTGRYSYEVANQWQGRFQKLQVIGDKQGGGSTRHLTNYPDSLQCLRETISLPIKFMHVVRNPYDNISTMARRKGCGLEETVQHYFSLCGEIERIKRQIDARDLFELRHESFIDDPQLSLRELCRFLGQDAPDDYLGDCAKIVYRSSHSSRCDAPWDDRLIHFVKDRIAEFTFLEGYSFASS